MCESAEARIERLAGASPEQLPGEPVDDEPRPRFANDNDGCGTWWYRRGRWSGWYDLSEWLVGVAVSRPSDAGYGHVVLRLGPVWIAWEFG